MTVLLDAVTEDTTSSTISVTGPVIVAVVGTFKSGRVKITVNLGSGEAVAFSCYPSDPVKVARLELVSGIDMIAYLEGSGDGNEVTVEYLDA